jgi:hypothetical protein
VLTDPNLLFFPLLLGLAGVGFPAAPGRVRPAAVGGLSLLAARPAPRPSTRPASP